MASPRGYIDYRPNSNTRALLEDVDRVLEEYQQQLPLTVRQVFYRLVATVGYDKSESSYARLTTCLANARRGDRIAWSAIRDDGARSWMATEYAGIPDFRQAMADEAARYQLDRQLGQQQFIELWVEAAGMAHQIARVCGEWSVPVYSTGGFDSLTAKHDAAQRALGREQHTLILHIGDHDPSGVNIFRVVAEDVAALAEDLVSVERIAITPEQAMSIGAPSALPKPGNHSPGWEGPTWQAEALPPDALAQIVDDELATRFDSTIFDERLRLEQRERTQLQDELQSD